MPHKWSSFSVVELNRSIKIKMNVNGNVLFYFVLASFMFNILRCR